MNVPILSGTVDLVALQNALTLILLDDPRMVCPIIPELRLYLESDQSVEALWTLPRSAFVVTPQGVTITAAQPGLVGAGILVEMPEFNVDSPQVRGSPATWDINIVAFEDRNMNFLQGTGTFITSEQYAELIIDILQLSFIYQFGTLYVKNNAITPAHDWMGLKPGIIAYRAGFKATIGRNQSVPTAAAVPTISAGTCTITCADGSANIYWTQDMSMPVSSNVNSSNPTGVGATVYTGPFAVTSGTTILAGARSAGKLQSPINGVTAP